MSKPIRIFGPTIQAIEGVRTVSDIFHDYLKALGQTDLFVRALTTTNLANVNSTKSRWHGMTAFQTYFDGNAQPYINVVASMGADLATYWTVGAAKNIAITIVNENRPKPQDLAAMEPFDAILVPEAAWVGELQSLNSQIKVRHLPPDPELLKTFFEEL